MTVPVTFAWTDEGAMKPLDRFARLCDRQFVVGETYRLGVIEERSADSHKHFMAAVEEAFQNVPEIHGKRWPTPDRLRKWALCQANFCVTTTYAATSKAEALRFVAYVASQGVADDLDMSDDGLTVYVKVAFSQSYHNMKRKEFQESKQAVLEVLSNLIGVSVDDLVHNAASAA